jgi:Na+-translocating ferredoxin:NAD+ oxidoreductase RnfD subunit
MSAPTVQVGRRAQPSRPRFQFDKRYLAPVLVTLVLLAGQVTFGFLESWTQTALAIATSIVLELLFARTLLGQWPHLASAYVSGISVGMLVRSPDYWPYIVCSALAITSKYLIRVDGRHIWNPSNLGIVVLLVLASDTVASLSVQWGNNLLPMITVWCFGAVIIHSLGRFHITLTYVASFVLFAALRAGWTGHPFLSEVAPITGPMYQLFIFFMITDPKTTVRGRGPQMLVAFLVAAVESALRMGQFVHAPYYALFMVGPAANLVEVALDRARARQSAVLTMPAKA